MSPQVKPIREGYHTAVPSLVVRDAARAVAFYEKADFNKALVPKKKEAEMTKVEKETTGSWRFL